MEQRLGLSGKWYSRHTSRLPHRVGSTLLAMLGPTEYRLLEVAVCSPSACVRITPLSISRPSGGSLAAPNEVYGALKRVVFVVHIVHIMAQADFSFVACQVFFSKQPVTTNQPSFIKYISSLSHMSNMTPPSQSNIFLNALCANSTPKNVAALAGTALANAGPNPGKKALIPPLP